MDYQRNILNENDEKKTVRLDNRDVSVQDFNKRLENLKPNQRIIETSDYDFHTIERLYD